VYCADNAAIMCNDLWSNTDDQTYGSCVLQPSNIYHDPEFCNPELLDYALNGTSPCLPANSPAGCGLIGALEQGCGPVAVEPATWGAIKATYR
jgi:hypothetical protein